MNRDFFKFYSGDQVLNFAYLHHALAFAKNNTMSGYIVCPDGERLEVA